MHFIHLLALTVPTTFWGWMERLGDDIVSGPVVIWYILTS
jgi:hypothetical protein